MSNEVILVVDDNHQIAEFTAGTLLRGMGYHTLISYDARSAREMLLKNQISLMLLDLQLPDMTGLELLRKLAGEGIRVPTILVTAHGSEQVAVDAFRLGVENYLIKPVDADELETAVERALIETRLRREKDALNAQLKEQVAMQTILAKVGQSVTSTLELDEVLRRIVEACVHFTRADEGFLALMDSRTGQLYLRAVKNIDEEKVKTMRLLVDDTLVGSVITTGRPLRISEADKQAPLKVSTGFFVHSLLHVPIYSRGKVIGVLSVDNHSSFRPFKDVDEMLVTSLADYAGVALENASLYQKSLQEIGERKRVEQALRESEERYALAVRGANDGLWDWDIKKNKVYYSPRWKEMIGMPEDGIGTKPEEWLDRIHPEDIEKTKLALTAHLQGDTSHFENEHRVRVSDGSFQWMQSRAIAVWDQSGVPIRMVGSLTDINDRKMAEEKLLHDAFHDTLTDLPNRTLFMDRLYHAVERAKRRENYLYAVLFLDIDRFKDVNDSLGHIAGDKLLIEVSMILAEGLRATDTVARLGGDEFVILLEDIDDISDATYIANRIQERLSSPFAISEHNVYISVSIGIVLSLTGYARPEDVLRDADIAMYRAKAHGKARFEIFDSAMRDRIMERLELERNLRQALDNEELRVYYQPIMDLSNDRIAGLEALVRWEHPARGLLYPAEFIPIAEETGLIVPLGMYVMREACRQMKQWHQNYPSEPPITISVNMSGKQIEEPNLITEICNILADTQLDPGCLKLEITESLIMHNVTATADVFKKLHELNVQIQIDDFGVGYSSLSYLSHFPLDTLKIDQSFVRALDRDKSHAKIVQAIVMLAQGLGLGVIAEGVETKEELEQIMTMGCEQAQGYFLAKPWDSETLEMLLEAQFAKEQEKLAGN